MQWIDGGITAAKGYKASGEHLGIRKNPGKRDVALVVSDQPATVAACFTKNRVKGAPLTVTKQHIQNGVAQAIICNSGNANTCNDNGIEIADGMCALVEQYTGIKAEDVVVASTGVIGWPMTLKPFAEGFPLLMESLSETGGHHAAKAIMTTDTVAKEVAVQFIMGGKTCTLGGMSKGSGMIHPNMATMLCFLTTDAAIPADMLQTALSAVVKDTFNMLSVDGDTSTNDTVAVLANGMAGNVWSNADETVFQEALYAVCEKLCRIMAKDGEGATKLITCVVTGAKDEQSAKAAARGVISSALVKSAMFGADANWGREMCAIGYSGADVDVEKIDIQFKSKAGLLEVCEMGRSIPFDEAEASDILREDEIDILVQCRDGEAKATAWGCDLTYDYVRINGDYRT
ncbi:MAG TPA: bifunctional glutamate N-acetyltransferase/amino-acid acetyltransferase ArgJ [Candidatus Limiplasma sp.]|nr:bifunctional glutamate N-acetyltransferase/amino-acid acetyltransferase ArgJ [Candidatus Limiplasma sp.]